MCKHIDNSLPYFRLRLIRDFQLVMLVAVTEVRPLGKLQPARAAHVCSRKGRLLSRRQLTGQLLRRVPAKDPSPTDSRLAAPSSLLRGVQTQHLTASIVGHSAKECVRHLPL